MPLKKISQSTSSNCFIVLKVPMILHKLYMASPIMDNSLLHFLLMKKVFKFLNKAFLIRDKYCHLRFCLRLMEPKNLSGTSIFLLLGPLIVTSFPLVRTQNPCLVILPWCDSDHTRAEEITWELP